MGDGRFFGKQIPPEVPRRLNSLISGGWYSANRAVFGSNPVYLFGWEEKDDDPLFFQDAPLSGRFAQQWKLRMMAQGAALKEVANSNPRRLLAYNKSFKYTDVKIGDTALTCNGATKKITPR